MEVKFSPAIKFIHKFGKKVQPCNTDLDKLRASVRRAHAAYFVQKSAVYTEITHQRRTADFWKFFSTAKDRYWDVLSAEKKPAYIYQITWSMSRLRIGNSFLLFVDHARTSHLTDFESFIDSQRHVSRNY